MNELCGSEWSYYDCLTKNKCSYSGLKGKTVTLWSKFIHLNVHVQCFPSISRIQ